MRIKGGKTPVTLGLQIARMATVFPAFTYDHATKTWRGPLQPTGESPEYRIKLIYRPPRSPQVFMVSPTPHAGAKHCYEDGSLCLYYPHDGDWHAGRFLADTIVPWTAEWLFYYETWLLDPKRRWFGPEAPHGRAKVSKR